MSTRSTPFGLFAFVTTGEFGDVPSAFFTQAGLIKRARPDMDWIYLSIQKLYQEEVGFESLLLRSNPLNQCVGDRVVLKFLRTGGQESEDGKEFVSIRNTELVRCILSLSKRPIVVHHLLRELDKYIPELEHERTCKLLRELVAQQVLLPGMLPSLLDPTLYEKLALLYDQIGCKSYSKSALGEGVGQFMALNSAMKKKMETKACLQVDLAHKKRCITLPKNIAEEGADAAAILWTIWAGRGKIAKSQKFHGKFIEKYGTSRTVPLMEMLHPTKGLSRIEEEEKPTTQFAEAWDEWLMHQWQECVVGGKLEWNLTWEEVERRFSQSKEALPDPKEATPSFDLFLKLIASSCEAIQSGDYRLLISHPTSQAGSTFGRFLDVLDEKTTDQLRACHQKEEENEPGVLFFEMSGWPLFARGANVAIHDCLRGWSLDIETNRAQSLTLDDIYVGATLDRVYLTTKKGGKELIARVGNMLDPARYPEPLRFIRDISSKKYQNFSSFSWGRLEKTADWFPRVTYQKTILSPAKWICRPSIFYGIKDLERAFKEWVEKWKLPQEVLLVRRDHKLYVKLTHPEHLKKILNTLKKGHLIHFEEAFEGTWVTSQMGGHLSEIVIPYTKIKEQATRSLITRPYHEVASEERYVFPGGEWSSMKLYLPREGMDRFLTDHLNLVFKNLVQTKWFFLRYGDPESHLRVRVYFATAEEWTIFLREFQQIIVLWKRLGFIADFKIDTYEREVERYGGSESLVQMEHFFYLDSLSILSLLSAAIPQGVVLHTLSVIAFLKGWGMTRKEMVAFLSPTIKEQAILKGYRDHKNKLIELTRQLLVGESTEEVKPLVSSLSIRTQEYFKPENTVIQSLLHMHCNRLGAGLVAEKKACAYAHKVLLQLTYMKTL